MGFGMLVKRIYSARPKNPFMNYFFMMFLFFMLFDGVITYVIPLLVIEQGYSKTLVGIIFSSAAISGAFYSFFLYKIFKNAYFRTLFSFMLLIGLLYCFVIWNAYAFVLFVIGMIMWGFYYSLLNFGTLDFFSRFISQDDMSAKFGLLEAFRAIGYLLAPLVAGYLVVDKAVGWEPFVTALVFLSISAFFFILLLREAGGVQQFIPSVESYPKRSLFEEIRSWRRVGGYLFPLLFLVAISTLHDAFFMTLGPIVAERLIFEPFDGLFLTAYFAPLLFIGAFIGPITKVFGEKMTVIIGLFIGSVILATISFIENPIIIILVVFASACFTCLATPIANSISANYIQAAPDAKKEVLELKDFFFNIGYIIGPVAAGIMADTVGAIQAFSVLGVVGILFAGILFFIMPDKYESSSPPQETGN